MLQTPPTGFAPANHFWSTVFKTASSLPGQTAYLSAGGGTRTHTGQALRILSPVRLPIPPRPHILETRALPPLIGTHIYLLNAPNLLNVKSNSVELIPQSSVRYSTPGRIWTCKFLILSQTPMPIRLRGLIMREPCFMTSQVCVPALHLSPLFKPRAIMFTLQDLG